MIFDGIQAWKSMIAHLAEVGDHADPANSSPDTKRASVEEALWGLREEARCSIRNFLEHNIWNPLLGHTIQGPFQDLMRALTLDRIIKQASLVDPTRGRVAASLPK